MFLSTVKKNPIGFLIFLLFVVILPVATFLFSKSGLDVYKDIKKEMRFHKDSIRINVDKWATYNGDTLRNIDLLEQTILVAFWNKGEDMGKTIQVIKDIKKNFKAEDQLKMFQIIHTDDFSTDSTWNWMDYARKWELDTAEWKFVKGGDLTSYQIKGKPSSNMMAVLDGRVSRKDDTDNYLRGPVLCDYYDINKEEDRKKMLRNIVIVLPKEGRKKLEFKAEEKLF